MHTNNCIVVGSITLRQRRHRGLVRLSTEIRLNSPDHQLLNSSSNDESRKSTYRNDNQNTQQAAR